MRRRQFLTWFSRCIYTACGLTVAAAGSRFLGAPLIDSSSARRSRRYRLAPLDSLPVGKAQLLAVQGTYQNAWVRQPNQVLGNAWVTRLSPKETSPENTELLVLSATCPHNGCAVQKAMKRNQGFTCHCHGARFQPDGARIADTQEFTNPSPRGMDPLSHELVQDSQTKQWWVEIVYQEFETGQSERVVKG